MREIVALLQSIAPVISTTTLRQLSQVVYGMLICNGRITMLELSRWTEKGGSYRKIQRLYHTPILWLQIQWMLFTSQFHQTDRKYIAVGDEVVFGKAGKVTHGLGRFFSSLQNRVIQGLSFFVFSLIDVQERQSYPIQAVQIIKEPKQPKKKEKENHLKRRSIRLVFRKAARTRKRNHRSWARNYCAFSRFCRHFW